MLIKTTHKTGEYNIQIDVSNQGRLGRVAKYYGVAGYMALTAVIHRGLASILIQVEQEKAEVNRRKELEQSTNDVKEPG